MKLICPECKNNVDLTTYTTIDVEQVIECNTCGITLMIKHIADDQVDADIVDEGK